MRKQQSGFTLIELVVVIVILGILAATALPKFIDLSDDAAEAAVQGMAGSLSSASAINYGARKANSTKGLTVATCADAATLLEGGVDSTKYTISGTAPTCTITDAIHTGHSAAFTATLVP